MQKIVLLSVTEAKTVAGVQCAQDMLYVRRLIESMGLQVELPRILEIDNIGAVDLANSWSTGRRTCHMETCIALVERDENPVDLFTKNLVGPAFNKCMKIFVGEDDYVKKG
eukprot:13349619-Ditylum_brightwellii.AAC.1